MLNSRESKDRFDVDLADRLARFIQQSPAESPTLDEMDRRRGVLGLPEEHHDLGPRPRGELRSSATLFLARLRFSQDSDRPSAVFEFED